MTYGKGIKYPMDSMNEVKLKAFFLINNQENNSSSGQPKQSIHQFSDLVKTCNFDVTFAQNLPNIAQAKDFDILFFDVRNCIFGDSIPQEIQQLADNNRVVFFNAPENKYDETQLLLSNIGGIFYQDERLDIVMRGITLLQKNQRWFKRETMNNAFSELLVNAKKSQEFTSSPFQKKISSPDLTKRENTIIGLVSCGAKNQEIADQLHISPNTVKTHLYSIFRKTSSRNRIELIGWSQNFLSTSN